MQVTSSPAATTTSASTSAATKKTSESASAASNLAGDFDTFLKLLTTQMKNQDPLNPQDSTEFVSQLASFSAVEQQIQSNDRLDSILDALSGGTASGLASWIGREVRAPAATDFTGDPIDVGVDQADGATRGVLVVYNDFGTEVARRDVKGSAESVTWDGKDNVGNQLADGRYRFSFESYKDDSLLGTSVGNVFTTVTEVRMVDGSAMLVLADGSQVTANSVTGIR